MDFWVWDLAMLIEIFGAHTFCDKQIPEGLSENTFNGLHLIPIVFGKDFKLQVWCVPLRTYEQVYISQRYT